MSRLWARFAGLFSSKSLIGADKTGNKYFSRMEEIDGLGEYCSSIFLPHISTLLLLSYFD